jgi:hypothetical protein
MTLIPQKPECEPISKQHSWSLIVHLNDPEIPPHHFMFKAETLLEATKLAKTLISDLFDDDFGRWTISG